MNIIEEKEIIIDLNEGPLIYGLPTFEPDYTMLQYQNYYKTYEYQLLKWETGILNLPGHERILQEIANKQKSPLEEMNERLNEPIKKLISDEIDPEYTAFKMEILKDTNENLINTKTNLYFSN